MELQVIRTIHPVGQGAFYTETLHRPGLNDDKHIVYDCGVKPYSNRLVEEICNFLPNKSTIDVLFISHFHEDHVNGIKLLAERYKIKHVVLPQIDDYDWYYIIENYLTTGHADVNVVSDLKAAIGDAKLIKVEPMDENGNGYVSDEDIAIDNINPKVAFNGRSPLVIDRKDFGLWHFIVINPLKKRDLDELKEALVNIDYDGRKLTIDDLRNPVVLTALRSEIQKAYERVFKGGNEYSMCMLSELAKRGLYQSRSKYNKDIHLCDGWRCYVNCYEDYFSDIDGGLYCGDADFWRCDTLECLEARLGRRALNVGLLQLPHHGSKENFNIELLNWLKYLQVSFACYGSPNRYKHPSSTVMGAAGTYSHVVGVNQYKSNVLTERIDVFERE